MAETLANIDIIAATATPSVVVEEAIGGWYQTYLRATFENWPRREEDLESLVDFASKHQSLAEMLSQLVLLSSESGDRVVKQGESCIRLSTIHQSKGLEYPHVFIIGLADGLFPNKRAIDGEGGLGGRKEALLCGYYAGRTIFTPTLPHPRQPKRYARTADAKQVHQRTSRVSL